MKILKTANVFNIPAGEPFMDNLLSLLKENNPEDMLDTIIFLPTNRAVRILSQKFGEISANSYNLPNPKIFSFNDINNDDTIISILNTQKLSGHLKDFFVDEKPPIDEFSRILIISELIKNQSNKLGKHYSTLHSIIQAKEFIDLIDYFFNSGASLNSLKLLKNDDLADHQLEILNFLENIASRWEELLDRLEIADFTLQTSRRLNKIAKILKENNYNKPIIAAGSTGTLPSTRNLLETIAYLPKGKLILPGLVNTIEEYVWKKIDECHPQYGLKILLKEINVNKDKVRNLKSLSNAKNSHSTFVNEAMNPPLATHKWHELLKKYDSKFIKNSLRNFSLIECKNEDEEANTIAIIIRKELSEKNQNIRFVTADHYLSRRVSSILKRWKININDSFGTPFHLTQTGLIWNMIAHTALNNFKPTDLLALLKHPLCYLGMQKKTVLEATYLLEKKILRNSYYLQDIRILKNLLSDNNPDFLSLEKKQKDLLLKLFSAIENNFLPFIKIQNKQNVYCKELLKIHQSIAEKITTNPNCLLSKERKLYMGSEGEKLKETLRLIKNSLDYLGKIKPEEWIEISQNLMQDIIIYPSINSFNHGVEILGILEARLGVSDLTIVGGLTEGIFPRNINNTNAWLNSNEMVHLNLPSPDRIIGLAAHDFYMLSSNSKVVLTYANYSEGELTQRSRWIDRLVALSKTLNLPFGQKHLAAKEWMKQDRNTPLSTTNIDDFSPPKEARITKISISDLERLEKEPYAIYAKNILDLKPLNPITQKPSARIFGIILHQIIENYYKSNIYKSVHFNSTRIKLLALALEQIKPFKSFPETYAFWTKKLELITEWIIKNDISRQSITKNIYIEVPGKIIINTHMGKFTLIARADRIEVNNGKITIIDYKSGTIPKPNTINNLSSPQLPIEILIALNKGFNQIQTQNIKEAIYWHLDGLNEGGKELNTLKDNTSLEEIANIANEWAKNILMHYANPKNPFLPKKSIYEDYKLIQRTLTLDANNIYLKDEVEK